MSGRGRREPRSDSVGKTTSESSPPRVSVEASRSPEFRWVRDGAACGESDKVLKEVGKGWTFEGGPEDGGRSSGVLWGLRE